MENKKQSMQYFPSFLQLLRMGFGCAGMLVQKRTTLNEANDGFHFTEAN
jgi:hypothetical protein